MKSFIIIVVILIQLAASYKDICSKITCFPLQCSTGERSRICRVGTDANGNVFGVCFCKSVKVVDSSAQLGGVAVGTASAFDGQTCVTTTTTTTTTLMEMFVASSGHRGLFEAELLPQAAGEGVVLAAVVSFDQANGHVTSVAPLIFYVSGSTQAPNTLTDIEEGDVECDR